MRNRMKLGLENLERREVFSTSMGLDIPAAGDFNTDGADTVGVVATVDLSLDGSNDSATQFRLSIGDLPCERVAKAINADEFFHLVGRDAA